jgi:hypothetical protein
MAAPSPRPAPVTSATSEMSHLRLIDGRMGPRSCPTRTGFRGRRRLRSGLRLGSSECSHPFVGGRAPRARPASPAARAGRAAPGWPRRPPSHPHRRTHGDTSRKTHNQPSSGMTARQTLVRVAGQAPWPALRATQRASRAKPRPDELGTPREGHLNQQAKPAPRAGAQRPACRDRPPLAAPLPPAQRRRSPTASRPPLAARHSPPATRRTPPLAACPPPVARCAGRARSARLAATAQHRPPLTTRRQPTSACRRSPTASRPPSLAAGRTPPTPSAVSRVGWDGRSGPGCCRRKCGPRSTPGQNPPHHRKPGPHPSSPKSPETPSPRSRRPDRRSTGPG